MATTGLVGLCGRAHPQEVPSSDAAEVEQVLVTGTRIKTAIDERSMLVIPIDGESLRRAGNTAIVDVLKTTPALVGSRDSSDAGGNTQIAGGTGLSLLNLRNLGVSRTLVLVDGRRHVGALSGINAVEVDTIPLALIDRVEISTGGASAIYGADGVSGVVNFITRKDYEGFEASTFYGQSSNGDGEDLRLSVLTGLNFAQSRGHLTVAGEYSDENRVRARQRDFASSHYAPILGNPAEGVGDDPNVPDRVPVRDLRFTGISVDGAVDLDFDGIPEFNGDDTPFDFGSGVFGGRYQQGGDGALPYVGDLLPQKNRYTLDALLSFELAPRIRLFSDLKYSRTTSFAESQPSYVYSYIAPDYPFTPPNIAAAANGGFMLLSRMNFDLGLRNEDIERDTVRTVFGANGNLSKNISYEVSYVYGKADIDTVSGNNLLLDRFTAAIDAGIDPTTAMPACHASMGTSLYPPETFRSFTPGPGSGCAPINVFGNGSISRATAAWLLTDSRARTEIEQQVAQAFISGDTGKVFSLPAGPMGFAAGIEWRKERSDNEPALEDQLGAGFSGELPPSKGEYDVREVFGELSVPILRERPFAHALTIDGALRSSDYSTTGNATTWQTGLAWSPVPSATLRAGIARATRAPNIAELFGPTVPSYAYLDDPCDINMLNQGTSSRAANCSALLSGLGVNPSTYTNPNTGAQIAGQGTSNGDLDEERSKTHTIGLDLRPTTGLVISLGWYDIKLRDAINTTLSQQAVDACVDLPTLNNPLCGMITREPGVGAITGFVERPINIAAFNTEGYDFSVSYRLDPSRLGWASGLGIFDVSIVGNRLKEFTTKNLPSSPEESYLGTMHVPKLQANLELGWTRGPLSTRYRLEYFDETQRIQSRLRAAEPDVTEAKYFDYDDKLTQNIYAQYEFQVGLAAYVGINNLMDEKPGTGELAYPVDPRGRFFFVGLDYRRQER